MKSIYAFVRVRLPSSQDFLDGHYAATATIYTTYRIPQEDEESPQGNNLKEAFGKLIMARRQLMAAGADRR